MKSKDISPQLMAERFWNMDSIEQAEFFHCLASEIKKRNPKPAYEYGEMQWCYLADDLKKKSPEAWNMYLALSSFAFEHWPQKDRIWNI